MDNNKKIPDLDRIVRHVRDLPTLPRTVLKITSLVNDPQASAKDLSGVITDDQVLTARLLRLVNSSFYGFPKKIATVTNAIVLLGFDAIRNLLLTTSIFGLFKRKSEIDNAVLEKYWDHSLGCAIGAKIIGNYIGYEKIEELFVGGLLHDIGKIVEILFIPDQFEKICAATKEQNILMRIAEEDILGFNHADIGQSLAIRWNMPARLETIIANHHSPDETTQFLKETSIIHISDILCRSLDIGWSGDDVMPALNEQAWKELAIETDDVRMIMEEMQQEFGSLKGLFEY